MRGKKTPPRRKGAGNVFLRARPGALVSPSKRKTRRRTGFNQLSGTCTASSRPDPDPFRHQQSRGTTDSFAGDPENHLYTHCCFISMDVQGLFLLRNKHHLSNQGRK